jgi:hypothetical protein
MPGQYLNQAMADSNSSFINHPIIWHYKVSILTASLNNHLKKHTFLILALDDGESSASESGHFTPREILKMVNDVCQISG